MDLQKTITGTLAGLVGLFGLGLLIYVLLAPGMSETVLSDGTSMDLFRNYFPGIIVFEILFALLLVFIIYWSGAKGFNEGLRKGAVVGLLLGLAVALWVYSTTTLFNTSIIWWYGVTFLVRFAVAGGLIGWIMARGGEAVSA